MPWLPMIPVYIASPVSPPGDQSAEARLSELSGERQSFEKRVVKSDGTPMTYHFYDNGTTYQGQKWVPISDDEAQALGLGKASWPPGVTPRLRNGPP